MKKVLAIFVVLSLVVPYMAIANAENEAKEKIEVYDSFGNKIAEKIVTEEKAKEIEQELTEGKADAAIMHLLPKRMDFGVLTYVVSYGKGKVYIPLHRDRSFLRLFIRPIFFKYEKGFTFVKFGANYRWDRCKTFGDYGFMVRKQRGVMIGFIGLHIKIGHKLNPDTHIFVGGSFVMIGNDLLL
ncbi:MAG: hypothetical protein J7K12_01055 [Thermoplasmata archaeon]|nr:hypothetical protein [Thermoplasmata archaeon]